MSNRSQDGGSRQLQGDQRAEPVRPRWIPKTEQVLFLRNIFNSGTINPSKDETARILKHLEKFGPVEDVNIFYWFQNRRSKSRQRQRQIEAGVQAPRCTQCGAVININPYDNFLPVNTGSTSSSGPDNAHYSGEEFPSLLDQSGLQVQYEQNPFSCSPDATNFPYQSGVITVFINGVATEVGRGGLDIKGMFGGDNFVMFHSSGFPVQRNENGFLLQSLGEGENYFLVPQSLVDDSITRLSYQLSQGLVDESPEVPMK